MEVDSEKVEAIQRLKSPANKKQLQRVMGKFTYLSKFIKNYSEIMEPLRALLEKTQHGAGKRLRKTRLTNSRK